MSQNFGKIEGCNKHIPQCQHKCCDFDNNYILLYPGELEKSKLKKAHLKIIDDDHFGGKKAVCIKRCTEKGFKPLECKIYPYFPFVNIRGEVEILVNTRCPLTREELAEHREQFLKLWKNLIKDKTMSNWVRQAKLSGEYELENKAKT